LTGGFNNAPKPTYKALEQKVKELEKGAAKHKKVEEELLRNKILLESSIESSKDMIILSLDCEYRYLYFNKTHAESMSHVYGTRPQIGDCIFDHMKCKDDIEKVKKNYDRVFAGEGHVAIEKYGEGQLRYYYEIQYNPIYDEKNEIIGVTSFAQNIIARKKVEEELRESEERFRLLSEASFEVIAISEKGVILEANDQCASIYGYEPSQIIGMAVLNLVAPESRAWLWRTSGQIMKSPTSFWP